MRCPKAVSVRFATSLEIESPATAALHAEPKGVILVGIGELRADIPEIPLEERHDGFSGLTSAMASGIFVPPLRRSVATPHRPGIAVGRSGFVRTPAVVRGGKPRA